MKMDKTTQDFLLNTYKALAMQIDAFDKVVTEIRDTRTVDLKEGKNGTLLAVGDGVINVQKLADNMRKTESIHGLEVNLPFILEQYGEILTAMKCDDFILVAEIVEFELLPMLSEWFDELDALFNPEG